MDELDITQRLIDYIRDNNLVKGDRLPSGLALAKMFDCSASQIRTGLISLSALGLVEIRPRSGCFVSSIKSQLVIGVFSTYLNQTVENRSIGLLSIYEMKTMLDSEIFGIAAEVRTNNELIALNELIKKQEVLIDDTVGFVTADEAMHEKVAEITRNSLFLALMKSLHGMLRQDRIAHSQPNSRKDILDDHHALFLKIKENDVLGAKEFARKHSNRRTQSLLEEL